jgi:hypothetical protein
MNVVSKMDPKHEAIGANEDELFILTDVSNARAAFISLEIVASKARADISSRDRDGVPRRLANLAAIRDLGHTNVIAGHDVSTTS